MPDDFIDMCLICGGRSSTAPCHHVATVILE